MKIEWNKVTWYSKALAVALFVGVFFVGFCLGKKSTETTQSHTPAQDMQHPQENRNGDVKEEVKTMPDITPADVPLNSFNQPISLPEGWQYVLIPHKNIGGEIDGVLGYRFEKQGQEPNDYIMLHGFLQTNCGSAGEPESLCDTATGLYTPSQNSEVRSVYEQIKNQLTRKVAPSTPANITRITEKDTSWILYLDFLAPNPKWMGAGGESYLVNPEVAISSWEVDESVIAYRCGAGPDNNETTADIGIGLPLLIEQVQQRLRETSPEKEQFVSYYFTFENDRIISIQEQCLP